MSENLQANTGSDEMPAKPSIDGLEAKFSERWEAHQVYAFDRTKTREQIFSIDTPPPTVSGSSGCSTPRKLLSSVPNS